MAAVLYGILIAIFALALIGQAKGTLGDALNELTTTGSTSGGSSGNSSPQSSGGSQKRG